MFGRVINTSLGPASGCTLNEKHAGNTIKPAVRATQVSSRRMLKDSPVRERDLSK